MKYYAAQELDQLFTREIVEIHNDLAERVGENQVSGFRNKSTAVTRTMEMQGKVKNKEFQSNRRMTPIKSVDPEDLVKLGNTNIAYTSKTMEVCLQYNYPMTARRLGKLLYDNEGMKLISETYSLAIISYYVSTGFLEVVK